MHTAGNAPEGSAILTAHGRDSIWVRVPIAEIVDIAASFLEEPMNLSNLPPMVGKEAVAAV